MNAPRDFREMTTETVAADLTKAVLDELALMPKPWQQLPQSHQQDIIDRMSKRVVANVAMTVRLIAEAGRKTIVAEVESVAVKDGAKAVFKVSGSGIHDIVDAQGKEVLVIVSSPDEFMKGVHDIKGEPDQRAMDLGHEYRDDDGGGMPEYQPGDTEDAEIIDGEQLALPDHSAIEVTDDEVVELGELIPPDEEKTEEPEATDDIPVIDDPEPADEVTEDGEELSDDPPAATEK